MYLRCPCQSFEATYGYTESEEQKKWAKELEQLEHQFSDEDDEVQVLDIEEDKKGQEKMFSHPFQAQPSTSSAGEIEPTKPSKKIKTKASKYITPEPMDSDTKRKQTAKKSCIIRLETS